RPRSGLPVRPPLPATDPAPCPTRIPRSTQQSQRCKPTRPSKTARLRSASLAPLLQISLSQLHFVSCGCTPRLFTYVISCHRIGSGNAAHVGIPLARLPFFSNQKISPSVAFCTRSLRRLGRFPRPIASGPWHFAQ